MATKVKLIADSIITTDQLDLTSLDSHFTGGTGVSYSSGTISIGQAVATTDNVTFADLTVTGNLNITGDINSYNVTDLDVTDKTITLGAGQIESNSGGSGIIVDGSGASILWNESNTEWDFNNDINVTGTVTSDGLTVDGVANFNANNINYTGTSPKINFFESDTTDRNTRIESSGSLFSIKTLTDNAATATKRFELNHSTGDISFYDSTGTTEGLFWDASTESLGIGTTSPAQALVVNRSSGNTYLDISRATQSQGQVALQLTGGTGGTNWIMYQDTSSNDLRFFGNSANRMTIDTSGNVGIGTDDPQQLLHLNAASPNILLSGTSFPALKFSGSDNIIDAEIYYGVGASDLWINNYNSGIIAFKTNSSERMRIDNDGNVGIGNSSLSSLYWPNGSTGGLFLQAGGLLSAYNAGTNLSQNWYYNAGEKFIGNGGASRYVQSGQEHIWSRSTTVNTSGAGAALTWSESVRIDENGNVGIGIQNPNNKLEVDGHFGFSKNGTDGNRWLLIEGADSTYAGTLNIQAGFGSTAAGGAIKLYAHSHATYPGSVWIGRSAGASGNIMFGNGGTGPTSSSQIQMVINSSGNVGINNSNPGAALDIIGSGYEDIRLGNNRTDNTNKLAGITAYMYTNNTVSMFQMFNQNGSNITYYGSADGAHRGVQAHSFYVNTNYNSTTGHTKALEIRSDGDVHAAYTGSADTSGYFYAGKDYGATNHRINRNVAQGTPILVVSGYGGSGIGADTALFYACAQGGANGAGSAMNIEKSSTNNRSINAAGTVNASGSDYAEYVKKSDTCGTIAKGDICGINASGEITDKWSEAHSFVVKSTDPSYVGGDIWGSEDTVGIKPKLTKQGYVNPEEKAPETDEEYAARVAQYENDLAAFETALEEQRVKYDRIAFSGQVPCNLTGASVGDYIIPKEGTSDSITGEAVSSPTFEEYQRAVGKVWKVLDNGNAWISVKIG